MASVADGMRTVWSGDRGLGGWRGLGLAFPERKLEAMYQRYQLRKTVDRLSGLCYALGKAVRCVLVLRAIRTFELGPDDIRTALLNSVGSVTSFFPTFVISFPNFFCLFVCFGSHLKFKTRLTLQLGVSLTCAFVLGVICNQLDDNSPSLDTLKWLVDALDTLFDVLTDFSGKKRTASSSPSVGSQCLHLILFVHIFVGCGILSCVIWQFEHRSRKLFLNSLAVEDTSPDVLNTLDGIKIFGFFCISVVFAYLSWELCGQLASKMHEWGSAAVI